MTEQRKVHRFNASVVVKQLENAEKQQFVLQYRGNISTEATSGSSTVCKEVD